MREKMTVREAKAGDVEAIIALWDEYMAFHEARDAAFARCEGAEKAFEAFLVENLASGVSLVAVAEIGGEIAGYCLAKIAPLPPVFARKQVGNILDTAVSARFRRRGAGRRLFEYAKEWFKARGIDRIELRVATANEVSTAFWASLGFRTYVEARYLSI